MGEVNQLRPIQDLLGMADLPGTEMYKVNQLLVTVGTRRKPEQAQLWYSFGNSPWYTNDKLGLHRAARTPQSSKKCYKANAP